MRCWSVRSFGGVVLTIEQLVHDLMQVNIRHRKLEVVVHQDAELVAGVVEGIGLVDPTSPHLTAPR